MNFLLFCDNFWFCFQGFETVFGSNFFGEYSLREAVSLVTDFTLSSIVFFRNAICFNENVNVIVSFESINSERLI